MVAKGFEDVVAYLGTGGAQAVLKRISVEGRGTAADRARLMSRLGRGEARAFMDREGYIPSWMEPALRDGWADLLNLVDDSDWAEPDLRDQLSAVADAAPWWPGVPGRPRDRQRRATPGRQPKETPSGNPKPVRRLDLPPELSDPRVRAWLMAALANPNTRNPGVRSIMMLLLTVSDSDTLAGLGRTFEVGAETIRRRLRAGMGVFTSSSYVSSDLRQELSEVLASIASERAAKRGGNGGQRPVPQGRAQFQALRASR